MYFPYLFARRHELLALREITEEVHSECDSCSNRRASQRDFRDLKALPVRCSAKLESRLLS